MWVLTRYRAHKSKMADIYIIAIKGIGIKCCHKADKRDTLLEPGPIYQFWMVATLNK